jgi:hypothetical protein
VRTDRPLSLTILINNYVAFLTSSIEPAFHSCDQAGAKSLLRLLGAT